MADVLRGAKLRRLAGLLRQRQKQAEAGALPLSTGSAGLAEEVVVVGSLYSAKYPRECTTVELLLLLLYRRYVLAKTSFIQGNVFGAAVPANAAAWME